MKTNGYSGEASLARRRAERASARRRRAAALLALALAGALALGGTVAWLTAATPAVVNTFSPAKVTTTIDEDLGDGVKKDVSIKNTGDVPVYVRAQVVVNWVDEAGDVYGEAPVAKTAGAAEGGYDYEINYNEDSQSDYGGKWMKGADGFWYWLGRVAPGATTGILVGSCEPVAGKAPEGYHLSVEILSQAIQADGTTSDGTPAVADAWSNDEVTLIVNSDGTLSVTTVAQGE